MTIDDISHWTMLSGVGHIALADRGDGWVTAACGRAARSGRGGSGDGSTDDVVPGVGTMAMGKSGGRKMSRLDEIKARAKEARRTGINVYSHADVQWLIDQVEDLGAGVEAGKRAAQAAREMTDTLLEIERSGHMAAKQAWIGALPAHDPLTCPCCTTLRRQREALRAAVVVLEAIAARLHEPATDVQRAEAAVLLRVIAAGRRALEEP